MSEELKPQAQAASVVTTAESAYLEEIKKIDNPAERLKESLEGLEDYGDFDLLETMADGLENMNPESRAAKKIFLQDSEFAEQRKHLKTDLLMWLNILDSDATTASEAVEKCQEVQRLLKRTSFRTWVAYTNRPANWKRLIVHSESSLQTLVRRN